MKKEIVNYLLECGVRPKLLGFAYLCRAVEMTIENGCVLPKITKILYPKIAEEYNTTPSRAERGIRNAIRTSKKEYRLLNNSEFISKAAINVKLR